MRLRTFAALLAAALLAWPAAGQDIRGSIEGYVRDASGAVLPGVTVTLEGGSGVKIDTVSDGQGQYRFPSIAPGRYSVSANLSGFHPGKVPDVDVALGQAKKVDFALAVAGVTETVQVTAESPLVDVKQSGRSTNIRAEQVDLLPHGRDFTTLVTQAPGANNEPKSNGIMIDGATASENRYVIDGTETTDLVHGTPGKTLVADFIDEVQVKSSGYPAEFGGSTGGVINVITKSGTNRYNGQALYYFQGSRLNGDSNKSLRLDPLNSSAAQYWTYPKDTINHSEPGGSIGGPILENRAWFWAGYLPTFETTDRTVNASSAGLATATPASQTQKYQVQYLTANQNTQFGDKLRTKIAFNNSWNKTTGLLPTLNGTDPADVNYTKGTKHPNWTLSGQADYIVNPKFFVGFRAGYFLSDTHEFNVPAAPRIIFSNSNIGFVGSNGVAVPSDLTRASGFASLPAGGNSAVDKDKQTRTFLQADATWYGHFAGDHQLKGGVQIDRRGEDILSGETGHRVTVRWGQPLSTGVPVQQGPFGYYSVRSNGVAPAKGFITQGNVKSNLVGFFVQDSWTLNNRLTVNAGIRTEDEKVPSFTSGAGIPAYPIEFGFGQKLAPRLGFAYDVTGNGRSKVYGSWGIFYDIFKLELPQGSFGGQKWLEYYYTLDTPNWTNLDAGSNCPPACSGQLIRGPIDFRLPSFGSDAIEPDLKPMKSQELSFGYEHQIGNVLAGSVRYVHKQIDRAIEDTGFLTPDGSEGYVIANPGEGITQLAFTDPRTNLPKAKRDYDGVEFALEKRFSNNWFGRATYLWSRLHGNYPGLSQTDENGRADPNVGRTFDYPLMMFKEDGTPNYGPLPTDRPHQVKLAAFYQFHFGTTLGFNQRVQSGLPISTELAVLPPNNYPVQYLGRGNGGRTPVFSQTDLLLQHDIRVGGRRAIQLQLNVLNLFNQRTAINSFMTYQQFDGITFNEAAFYRGQVDFDRLITTEGVVKDPRYLMQNGFQDPIAARFGVKFSF
jgi:outer membrane receptor protein involved in Fe transport